MLVLGLGLGMVMQVLVIAVQNAVDYRDLGVATSGATLFRLIGGSLGTAVLGAIFAARLEANLARLLPPGTGASGLGAGMNPQAMLQLPAALRAAYAQAFTASLSTVFLVAGFIAFFAFLLTWLLPERPLRQTVAAATAEDIGGDVGQAFAMPVDADPLSQVLRGLSLLAERDVKRQFIQEIVRRAGVELSPAAAWLLVQLEKEPAFDVAEFSRARNIELDRLHAGLAELKDRGLVLGKTSNDGKQTYDLTEAGCDMLGRLVTARRAHMEEVLSEWSPEKREEIVTLLNRITRELIPRGQARLAGESPHL
jgi:DNA-binding MarR family transcriptional regulator